MLKCSPLALQRHLVLGEYLTNLRCEGVRGLEQPVERLFLRVQLVFRNR